MCVCVPFRSELNGGASFLISQVPIGGETSDVPFPRLSLNMVRRILFSS